MNPLKPYLCGALVIAILSMLGYVHWLSQSRDKYMAQAAYEKSEKDKSIATANKMIQDNQKAESNRKNYLSELEQSENERKRLEKCIADKSCVPIIKLRIPAVCTASKENNSTGTSASTEIIDPNAQRAYLNLREGIEQIEAKYSFCQETLRLWVN